MRSFARSALPALLTLLCVTACALAQSTSKQSAPKTSRGSVSGRVTIKEKPAPGVTVGLRRGDLAGPYEPFSKAVTDADGVYRITNVAPGVYQLAPAAPAFVVSDLNTRKNVVVAEDENVEGINFSLVRGGVITGKVTDADGRPLIAQQVEIYRADILDQRTAERPAYPESTGQTDDRGIYRVFGLAAGRYKVSAGRGEEGYGGYSPIQTMFRQVFHPDVTESAKGTVIEVSEGGEAKNIDINLGRAVETFSVSGRLISGENGSPVPNMRFTFQRYRGQGSEFVNIGFNTNARGDFIAEGLIPGKYGVVLFPTESFDYRAESTTFEIVDQDVTGVVVKLTKGASISGVVILESEDKAAQGKLSQMQVRGFMQPSAKSGFGSSASSPIAADGSFRLAGLTTGTVNLSMGATNGPYPLKGFSISRVERDGNAAPLIEIKDGEQITGVKVFVAYGNAILRGVVNIENGPLPANARIFVRLTKPGENMSYLRPPPVDERGHFVMEGIPAGLYDLVVYVVGNFKPGKPLKQSVSLTDGATSEVTVTLDWAAQTNPKP